LWREKLASKSLTVEGLLAERPIKSKQPLLVIADQFEELFTLCKDEQEQRQFLECLLPVFNPDSAARHGCRVWHFPPMVSNWLLVQAIKR
jgi:hypothetical protein